MSNNFEQLSKAFGEPEFLTAMRRDAFLLSKKLTDKPYGIGISGSVQKEEPKFEERPARYQYEKAQGVRVMPWEDAMKDTEIISVIEKYFTIPDFTDKHFSGSFANFGDGLVIIAEKGSDATFEFSSLIEKDGSDLIFILAEENSTLRVFEDTKSENTVSFGKNVFVLVERGASVTYAGTSNVRAGSSFFPHKFSRVLSDAKIEWYDLFDGAETVRSLTEDALAGEGAESYSYNISICSEEHFDIYHTDHHEADHTASHIFSRGIAGGGGKIVYRALSDIRHGISGATGRQDGRFLITSSGAEIDAIPSLDIAGSESNSSHALSISHLTDKDFFYPALRGIAPYRAQAMLLSGFLAKLLEKLPEKWQTKLLEKINKKLSSPLFRVGE